MYRPTALLPLLWQLDAIDPPTNTREVREYYRLLVACGLRYYHQGHYPQAQQMMESFFAPAAWKKNSWLPMKEEEISALNLNGMVNLKQGRYRQAEQYCHHAVRLSEIVFGLAHPSTAASGG